MKVLLGIPLLLIIIFIYTGLAVLTREIFADKKCNVDLPATLLMPTTTTVKAQPAPPAPFNNIIEGFSDNAVRLDLNDSELIFSKGAIVLLWIIVIITTFSSFFALIM